MRLHLAFFLISACACSSVEAAETPVHFGRDVLPILAENCFQCHGPDEATREADLRLDLFANATADRDGVSVIVPHNSHKSDLMQRISTADEDLRMPPVTTGKKLSSAQIEKLRHWIDQGARYEQHWAFQPPTKVVLPPVQDPTNAYSPIDHFILGKLDEKSLIPSPEANRYTLIRRLYLDLLGLLPTPSEVDAFVHDHRPDAYERLVDRLLHNPHMGERWGRYWLDQARYADSHGYTNDDPRIMWPYRDWVIQAFNRDLPFDEFTIEQLAGDLLADRTQDQLIATGFHRNTLINTEGGVKTDQYRDEQVKDRVDTTALVWMALTVGCAKCHSHKYDPIEQSEYYQLYAFFNSTADQNSIAPFIRLADEALAREAADLEQTIKVLKAEITKVEEATDELPDGHQQKKDRLKQLETSLQQLEKKAPKAMVLKELPDPRITHVQMRGDFLRPQQEVESTTPKCLPSIHHGTKIGSRNTRLELARWLTSPEHPLTARVRINRIWMRLFGRGLVETENDFGTQGSLPSHPELLDWLAGEFRRDWSTKRILRLIVTSAVYRQSSAHRTDIQQIDPRNLLFSRQSRLRVDAEIVRDCALSVSGMLTSTIGGPSVYPPQPDGVYAFTQHVREWPTEKGENRFRRGMYTFFFRSAPHPMLTTFDVPKFNQTCTCRTRSNTPLQSLTVANDKALFELAEGLGDRVCHELPQDNDRTRLNLIFRIALVRAPVRYELNRLALYLASERQRLVDETDSEKLAWTSVARVIMNLDEFITRE